MADGLINIVPLSVKNLAGAIALIKKVFVYEEDRNVAYMNFIETLQGENHGQSYWVALDKQNNVIGITGLYLDDDFADKESTVWLGWFGVHPQYRRQGIGSALLEFAINEAKQRQYEVMKIYTTIYVSEAHKLYGKYGFEKMNLLNHGKDVFFVKLIEKSSFYREGTI